MYHCAVISSIKSILSTLFLKCHLRENMNKNKDKTICISKVKENIRVIGNSYDIMINKKFSVVFIINFLINYWFRKIRGK